MQLSPMMKHYKQLKSEYQDCIIFYRLGDFYEMFFEDAVEASKILDIVLTGRDCGLENKAPMCGVPFHSADAYIAKLVESGKKVAICEQLDKPTPGKKLVSRDVVRIITAGTLTEDSQIDSKSNNFIASVYIEGEKASIAWADITTGEFYVNGFTHDKNCKNLCDNLVRISPSEIICSESVYVVASKLKVVQMGIIPKFNMHNQYSYSKVSAEKTIKNHFQTLSLSMFKFANDNEKISASGSLLDYLSTTQKHSLINITNIIEKDLSEYMFLDEVASRNLDLVKCGIDRKKFGSLLHTIDNTKTAMGSRNLNSWVLNPLTNYDKILYRQQGVKHLVESPLLLSSLTELLSSINDIERLASKVSNGNITPKDMGVIAESLDILPKVKQKLSGEQVQILCDVESRIMDFTEISLLLNKAIISKPPTTIKDGGFISEGFDKKLDELKNLYKNTEKIIRELEDAEREKTGIKTLRIASNKVFGYYIEVGNQYSEKVPFNYIRKQTTANKERYITEELKQLETEIFSAKENSILIELEIFEKLILLLKNNLTNILTTAKAIACLDCLTSFAKLARQNDYVMPIITKDDGVIDIVGGRHAVVEKLSNEKFIPNDTLLDNNGNLINIITGPNMGGKSTYMRQVAIICCLAQMGSFVPAKRATLSIVDKIFTRIGASDNLILDQSTFMVEMVEVASILRSATSKSLLILDEVGRGTSTYDGLSIAWAVIDEIASKIKAKTLFATHYHELSHLESTLDCVKNLKVTVKESANTVVFLHKIMQGSANRSFGIEVASLAGVPKSVTSRAKAILKSLEKNSLICDIEIDDKEEKEEIILTEVEEILRDVDVNQLTPINAFNLIINLKGKVRNGD